MSNPLLRDLVETQSRQVSYRDVFIRYWSCRQHSAIPPNPASFLRFTRDELEAIHADISNPEPLLPDQKPSSGIKAWYNQVLADYPGFLWLIPPLLARIVERADTSPRLTGICDLWMRGLQALPIPRFKTTKGANNLRRELKEVFPKSIQKLSETATQESLIKLVSNPLKHWPGLNPWGTSTEIVTRMAEGWERNGSAIWFENKDEVLETLYGQNKSGNKILFDADVRAQIARYLINATVYSLSSDSDREKLSYLKRALFNLMFVQSCIEDNYH